MFGLRGELIGVVHVVEVEAFLKFDVALPKLGLPIDFREVCLIFVLGITLNKTELRALFCKANL